MITRGTAPPRCLPCSTCWRARSSAAACSATGIRSSSGSFAIEAEIPVGKIIHVILDNYGPRKHPKTRAWLGRHPRFVFHYTPTSASWLNAFEGFFAKLSKRRLKRGVFGSIVDLQAAINRFLRETNDNPKPFVWTADPDRIIAAVRRGYQALDSVH
jgi:transposase